MRRGPIVSEVRSKELDRSSVSYPLWEQQSGAPPELPWRSADSLLPADVQALLAPSHRAVLVAGRGGTGAALLDHSITHVPASCRLYVYGSKAFEADARLGSRLATLSDRVLCRLGFDAPADWLVVDGGREALLFIGPPGQPRRWMIRVDGALARALHEAARFLFWFHAAREGLPDASGAFAFRTPLLAPFPHPGNDLALSAGRILVGGRLPEAVVDADIRVVTHGALPGRAAVVFLRPDAKSFEVPTRLKGARAEVVWGETGLPETAVSRDRVVLDLVEDPIGLQLEWPKQDAIDLYHRLSKAARKAEWQFHHQKRLDQINGPVLLETAASAARVRDVEVIKVKDVLAKIAAFESSEPATFPDSPALTRRVTYQWTVVPEPLPAGARVAELVRRWHAVDEWARRRVEGLRGVLAAMEGEEKGFVEKLRAMFTAHGDLRRRRNALRERLDELGETGPSKVPDAVALVERIVVAGRDVVELVQQFHQSRVAAEHAVVEAQQRAEWEARVRQAAEDLTAKRQDLAALEQSEAVAGAALEEADKKLAARIEILREERRPELTGEKDRATAELELARAEHSALSGAPKPQRKEAARKVTDLEQRLARVQRDLDALSSWSPPGNMVLELREEATRAKDARDRARAAQKAMAAEIRRLDHQAGEAFDFKAPPKSAGPTLPQEGAPPAVPDEALPELGDLFEHRDRRYLAVKTWEQVPPALPVAERLRADLVSFTQNP